jgi:hypothetical protein
VLDRLEHVVDDAVEVQEESIAFLFVGRDDVLVAVGDLIEIQRDAHCSPISLVY